MKKRRVLLLGASHFTFSDTGPEGMPAALLERELARLSTDVRWWCEGARLFHSQDMVSRAVQTIEATKPDVVVLDYSVFQLVHATVGNRIRKKWPQLHALATALMKGTQRLAGGAFEGGRGPRARLFSLGRTIGLRLVGGEPDISVEAARANAVGLLDYLVLQDLKVVSRDPNIWWHEPGSQITGVRCTMEAFRRPIFTFCDSHGISRYDLEVELGRLGGRIILSRDNLHYDLATREAEARILGPMVVAATEDQAALTLQGG